MYQHGTARVLCTDRYPQGIPPRSKEVLDANLLAHRMAALAYDQYRTGGWFTIENPEKSFIWSLRCMQRLAGLEGVSLLCGDQCCLGSEFIKPTGWLTNAAWMGVVVQRCPGEPTHPPHTPLRGRVVNHLGNEVWLTSLAAEYCYQQDLAPQGTNPRQEHA